jgi:hypothetical protein
MTTITETCACGATFHYVGTSPLMATDAWREGHKHAESVGICGDQPPLPDNFPKHLPSPHCALKAGHGGMHGGGDGAHWREIANPTTTEPEGGER